MTQLAGSTLIIDQIGRKEATYTSKVSVGKRIWALSIVYDDLELTPEGYYTIKEVNDNWNLTPKTIPGDQRFI